MKLSSSHDLIIVYNRSSASCCPHGCNEYAILHADAETLADLEQEAEEAVQDANEELRRARAEVHRRLPSHEVHTLPLVAPDKTTSIPNETAADKDPTDTKHFVEEEDAFAGITDDIMAHHTYSAKSSSLSQRWEEAENLVASERNVIHKANRTKKYRLDNGHWPNPFHIWNQSAEHLTGEVSKKKPSTDGSSKIIDTDSYAVVTFTSRQAAIAARQCLADGCGLDRWREIDYVPIPPLADAPPWNILGESDGGGINALICFLPNFSDHHSPLQIAVDAVDLYQLLCQLSRKDGGEISSSWSSFFFACHIPFL